MKNRSKRAQNGQNSIMFRILSYYTVITGVITRTLDHGVISPSVHIGFGLFWGSPELILNKILLKRVWCRSLYLNHQGGRVAEKNVF